VSGVIAALLIAKESLDLGAIETPELVSQVGEKLEHGEGLLRRPQRGDDCKFAGNSDPLRGEFRVQS
jgi:hypothetical protein